MLGKNSDHGNVSKQGNSSAGTHRHGAWRRDQVHTTLVARISGNVCVTDHFQARRATLRVANLLPLAHKVSVLVAQLLRLANVSMASACLQYLPKQPKVKHNRVRMSTIQVAASPFQQVLVYARATGSQSFLKHARRCFKTKIRNITASVAQVASTAALLMILTGG